MWFCSLLVMIVGIWYVMTLETKRGLWGALSGDEIILRWNSRSRNGLVVGVICFSQCPRVSLKLHPLPLLRALSRDVQRRACAPMESTLIHLADGAGGCPTRPCCGARGGCASHPGAACPQAHVPPHRLPEVRGIEQEAFLVPPALPRAEQGRSERFLSFPQTG